MPSCAIPYEDGETQITAPGTVLAPLPGGPIDHHWTKSLLASPDGTKLYASVGSNSNITENGMGAELDRADILEVDRATGAFRVFASGLRNPNSMQWNPQSGKMWAVVNERDELGPDLVPDYLTSVKDGAFYGWPYSYYGQHVDPRVKPQRPDLVAKAIKPDYALSSHVAPLGLVFYTGSNLPAAYKGGAFVGEHGSWDRTPLNGYKVDLGAVHRRSSQRDAEGCGHRLPRLARQRARPAGRPGRRQQRRPADRRRPGQYGVAGDRSRQQRPVGALLQRD